MSIVEGVELKQECVLCAFRVGCLVVVWYSRLNLSNTACDAYGEAVQNEGPVGQLV